ncbi:hypothetical protein RAA17_14070 [Komagataeibacter rhaeticus]|nr:hypothetical protein [Komagataeibacter rhaeticus]
MMGLRAMGLLPPGMAAALAMMATGLTVLAMAALGLGNYRRARCCAQGGRWR